MTMEKISEAILGKIKKESDDIIKEAEEKARERVEKAREQHNARFQEEKTKKLGEAVSEASRIQAQTSISIRMELLKVKNEIINEIISRVTKKLADSPQGAQIAVDLINEGIRALNAKKVIVYVSAKDIDNIKTIVKKNKELSSRIVDIKETGCVGGAIVEDPESKLSINNTFDTRLETLVPRILPEISRELFGS